VRATKLRPEYVELMPKVIGEGVLYISQKYATAVHKCCCGCGEKVVTPLKPTEWSLSINHGAVTLCPSIGNWSFACRSHYWIRNSRVVWAGEMPQHEIERSRRRDLAVKREYFTRFNAHENRHNSRLPDDRPASLWKRLLAWLVQH